MVPPTVTTYAEMLSLAHGLASAGTRRILGIAGPPGAGKSTVTNRLANDLGPLAAVVRMDAYHLAGSQLERLGRSERKGAPDTFDVDGYLALLHRLRSQVDDVVYAPEFRREIEEPVSGAVPVCRSTPLVITEGNYLLLDDGRWSRVRGLLDEVWYLRLDAELRIQRLVARHISSGKSPEAALAWANGSDARNAQRIEKTSHRADRVIEIPQKLPETADASAPGIGSAGSSGGHADTRPPINHRM